MRAQPHQFEGDGVIAAEHIESQGSTGQNFFYLGDASAGFFDGHDVFKVVGQAQSGGCFEVHPRASRHVVEHYGHGRGFCHRGIVAVESFLRRLIIIRRHDEHPVNAFEVVVFQEGAHRSRVVAAASQQERHTARHSLDEEFGDALFFAVGQRRRFGRRAEGAKEVHASINKAVDVLAQAVEVHFPLRSERGNDSHSCTAKNVGSHVVLEFVLQNYGSFF